MPGLLGYVYSDIKQINCFGGLITRMIKCLMHEQWYKTDLLKGDKFAFARIHQNIFNPEPQPIYNKDRSLCIFMYGKIYGYENSLSMLEKSGYTFTHRNDPEYCLAIFEETGTGFVKELNGSFLIVIYDFKEEAILIFNDRYGLRPLYYNTDGNRLIFSSEVKAILTDQGFRKTLNQKMLASYFKIGQGLGSDTFFENIDVLPAGSILKYKKGKLQIHQYYNLRFKEEESISNCELVLRLVDVFQKAVSNIADSNHKYGIALSGGMDSRSILAAFPGYKHPNVFTFTFGQKGARELEIAKEASKVRNISNFVFDYDPSDIISPYSENVVDITDGMNTIGASHLLYVYRKLQHNVDVVFDGLGGNSLGGSHIPKAFYNMKSQIFQSEMKTRYKFGGYFSDDIFLSIFHKRCGRMFLTLFSESLDKDLEECDNQLPANKLESFMYKTRYRRLSIMGDVIMRSNFEIALPFMDNDVVDTILLMKPSFRKDYRNYREFLLKLSPELSKIEYFNIGVPISYPLYYRKMMHNYKRLSRKTERIIALLTKGKLMLNSQMPYADIGMWIRSSKQWQKFVKKQIEQLPDEYFNKDNSIGIYNKHLSGEIDYSNQLNYMTTFSIFFQKQFS